MIGALGQRHQPYNGPNNFLPAKLHKHAHARVAFAAAAVECNPIAMRPLSKRSLRKLVHLTDFVNSNGIHSRRRRPNGLAMFKQTNNNINNSNTKRPSMLVPAAAAQIYRSLACQPHKKGVIVCLLLSELSDNVFGAQNNSNQPNEQQQQQLAKVRLC